MRHLFASIFFFACLSTLFPQDFIQIGQDIDGKAAWDFSGTSVSLSSDGKIVAVGAPSEAGNNANAGRVSIYKLNATSWNQIGQDIVGEGDEDHSGKSLSLSSDGKTVAIGAVRNNAYAGHVRVYEFNGNIWNQIGRDIDGETALDNFGKSVSLSSDGKTVAIGAVGNDGSGENAGRVSIYKFNGTIWNQIGKDIDGLTAGDRSGKTVSLSSDGKTVAIGAPQNRKLRGNAGYVRVYYFMRTGWIKIGQDIVGEGDDDQYGNSVSLSSDGKTVAIGVFRYDGSGDGLRVYKLNGSSWDQIGQDIVAWSSNGSISLSSDGKTVAIGSPKFGRVRVYKLNGSSWGQIGQDVKAAAEDYFGSSVSLSSDGKTVAIGAVGNDDNGENAGHIRIFKLLSFEEKIKLFVEEKINIWQQKGEYEKTVAYQNRVNETTRNQMIKKYQKEAFEIEKKIYTESIDFKSIKIKNYDADNETFLLDSPYFGEFVLEVPINNAKNFKDNFNSVKYQNKNFDFSNNGFVLTKVDIVDSIGNVFSYTNKNQSTYAQTKINYNFSDIEIDLPKSQGSAYNITKTNNISVGKADVDINIPVNSYKNKNKYALVIGNEDYSSKQKTLSNEVDVEFARNDANSFKDYLVKTLGFESDHVTLLKDATSGEMYRELEKLVSLAKLDSKSEIVFYYAGHGLPDNDKNPYLIPVDVSSINLKQNGIALKKLYFKLASSNASKITVFLDACFSGGGRDQGLLAARGVKIKPKEEVFIGNMLVFASSSGEEKSLPYEEKQHGLFTYFLLKKLKETNGNATYAEISDYLRKEVSRKSLIENNLKQTPHTNISRTIDSNWKNWKLK